MIHDPGPLILTIKSVLKYSSEAFRVFRAIDMLPSKEEGTSPKTIFTSYTFLTPPSPTLTDLLDSSGLGYSFSLL
jgi:hypothetical protein